MKLTIELAKMSYLNDLNLWLKDYDVVFKVLSVIAAPGGLWFLIDKFRNRLRVKIRDLSLPPGNSALCGIVFEAENVSSIMTSFEPKFSLQGYYSPKPGERGKQTFQFTFDVASDRQLPPHVSKNFACWHNQPDSRMLLFMWFMTLKLELSQGRTIKVRVLNTNGFEQLGFFRFHWMRLQFVWFGTLPD